MKTVQNSRNLKLGMMGGGPQTISFSMVCLALHYQLIRVLRAVSPVLSSVLRCG